MTSISSTESHPAPWDYAAPWGAHGYITDLDGPLHWIEFSAGEPSQSHREPPVVFVHGLGGSHLNWCLLGPHLAAGRRAVALDLRGFGLTPGLRGNSTVHANARLLDRFVTEVIGAPVILVGNSMGGLISILETSNNPDAIAGVVLIDPALPLPPQKPDWQVSGQFLLYALPGLGPLAVAKLLARVQPEEAVQQLLRLCFADPSRADPEMIQGRCRAQHPASPGHARPGGGPRPGIPRRRPVPAPGPQPGAQRYAKMMAGIDVPVLLIGGEDDRLVPVAAMRRAAARNPRWESVILPGVGHTPMLEVPDDTSAVIGDWLDRHFKN